MEKIIRYIANNPEVSKKVCSGELALAGVSLEEHALLREVFKNEIDLKSFVVNAWKY